MAAVPGASDEAIQAFERAHGVRLPDDFRGYLQRVNGTGGQMDGDEFCFWGLREIKSVAEVLQHHQPDSDLFTGCFVFADYSISAWLWAIQLIGGDAEVGRVFLVPVDGTRGDPVAGSFSEFGQLYLEAPDRLHQSSRDPVAHQQRLPKPDANPSSEPRIEHSYSMSSLSRFGVFVSAGSTAPFGLACLTDAFGWTSSNPCGFVVLAAVGFPLGACLWFVGLFLPGRTAPTEPHAGRARPPRDHSPAAGLDDTPGEHGSGSG